MPFISNLCSPFEILKITSPIYKPSSFTKHRKVLNAAIFLHLHFEIGLSISPKGKLLDSETLKEGQKNKVPPAFHRRPILKTPRANAV